MTTYYLRPDGNDGAAGTSDPNAWATWDKVHDYSDSPGFAPGDVISPARGGTWREGFNDTSFHSSGAANSPITITPYGTGPDPILMGSLDWSTGWADQGSNVWRHTIASPGRDIGNIIFNGGTSIGRRYTAMPGSPAQGDYVPHYVSGETFDYVDMYSVGDPGSVYTSIEACQRMTGMAFSSISYVVLRYVDFRNFAWHGLPITSCSNIVVEYVDFAWMGGGVTVPGSNWARDGNGIMLWDSASNIWIRECGMTDIYEAGVSCQTMSATGDKSNVFIYHNAFQRTGRGLFDIWQYNTGAACDNFNFAHNIGYNMGGSLFAPQRASQYFTAFVIYSDPATYGPITNSKVLNNLFHTTATCYPYIRSNPAIAGLDIDYNCYYPITANGGELFTYESDMLSFADWKTASGKDANSITSDPTITTLGSNWQLVVGSPAINAGVVWSEAMHPSLGAGVDMGIYEYDSPVVLKRCPFRVAV